jgi:hypothetical protein
MADLHETDFHAWTHEQARLLRERRLTEADLDHIAEEIESMGRSEKRELVSRLNVLLGRLLTWRHQVERRGNSWRLSIENARDAIAVHLADNPSLKGRLVEAMETAHRSARREAAIETGLAIATLAPVCPWSFDAAIAEDFWPQDFWPEG